MKLEGRIALVTGGSRGIGRAIVERLAAEGAKVAFVYHSNSDAANAVVEEVIAKWGKIDILVNNAGIIRDGLLAVMEPANWQAVIDTNLGSVYNYCHAVMRPMMSERYGRIINISSVSAEYGNQGQVNYAASKGGMQGLTRCLATEIGRRNITVNAVAPGFIATDMTAAIRNAAESEIKKKIPVRRLGQPEDIAAAVLFLASDDASYITGHVLTVDGGLTLGGV